jgi:hypothetical protein
VLEDGRIIESGTHDELLASGGRYATFLRMQVEGHEKMEPIAQAIEDPWASADLEDEDGRADQTV